MFVFTTLVKNHFLVMWSLSEWVRMFLLHWPVQDHCTHSSQLHSGHLSRMLGNSLNILKRWWSFWTAQFISQTVPFVRNFCEQVRIWEYWDLRVKTSKLLCILKKCKWPTLVESGSMIWKFIFEVPHSYSAQYQLMLFIQLTRSSIFHVAMFSPIA